MWPAPLLLGCVLAAPGAGDRPGEPTWRSLALLLNRLLEAEAAERAQLSERLRVLAARFPARCQEILLRFRAWEQELQKALGGPSAAKGKGLLSEKLAEAERAYQEKDYRRAQTICEAILTLGPPGVVRAQAKRLARLARDRVFADRTLLLDLAPEKEVVPANAPIRLSLELLNRSEWDVELWWAPPGLLGQLDLSVTTITPAGQVWGTKSTQELQAPKARLHLAPGDTWKHTLEIEPRREEDAGLVERLVIRGRLIPTTIRIGGRTQTRQLRIPLVAVLRVPPGRDDLPADPLGQLRAAIKKGDGGLIFLVSCLCAWEGEIEGAVGALLEGTASPVRSTADTCYIVLRLLTGKNFGSDRSRWIRFFLSYEKLPVRGPLTEW